LSLSEDKLGDNIEKETVSICLPDALRIHTEVGNYCFRQPGIKGCLEVLGLNLPDAMTNNTMLIHLMIFRITDVLLTMVHLMFAHLTDGSPTTIVWRCWV